MSFQRKYTPVKPLSPSRALHFHHPQKFTSALFQSILKDFLVRWGDINECVVLMLYNEMCQNMEDIRNSVNQCFLNEQCVLLQRQCMGRRSR